MTTIPQTTFDAMILLQNKLFKIPKKISFISTRAKLPQQPELSVPNIVLSIEHSHSIDNRTLKPSEYTLNFFRDAGRFHHFSVGEEYTQFLNIIRSNRQFVRSISFLKIY